MCPLQHFVLVALVAEIIYDNVALLQYYQAESTKHAYGLSPEYMFMDCQAESRKHVYGLLESWLLLILLTCMQAGVVQLLFVLTFFTTP